MLQDNLKILINVSTFALEIYLSFLKFCHWILCGESVSNMKSAPSKRVARIEKKKKKMAALVEIAKLNEYDRAVKKKQVAKLNAEEILDTNNLVLEPSPKRQRTESEKKKKSNLSLQEISPVEDPSSDPPPPFEHHEIGPSGKEKLSGEDLIQLKKYLRERSNKLRQHPNFRLRDVGENARLSVEFDSRIPLFLSDLQHLIMYSQVGVHSPYSPARWCCLEKYNRLKNTIVLIVENVSLYDFTAHESLFPFLKHQSDHQLEILNPRTYKSDIIRDLSMVPLTGTQMRKFIGQYGTLEEAVTKSSDLFDIMKNLFPIEEYITNANHNLPPTDKFPRTHLLLSGWQMVEENFPLPIKGLAERKYIGYILTKDMYKPVTPFSPMFAIDCEMCRTSVGDLELTRVSIVNEKLELFYDTLVKPKNKIVDYLTRYSGITAKMMKNVTKTLEEVQEDLRKMLPSDAILVGQSLGNDLHALKMMHPYVIDTSVIFNITGDRARKTRLQTLAREFLSERIQESKKGHCSEEDSAACLKLVKLKLTKSLYFGDAVMGNYKNEIKVYPDMGTPDYATSMLKQVTKSDNKALVIGASDTAIKYKFYVGKGAEIDDKNITCLSEHSNHHVIESVCQSCKDYSLTIGHIVVQENQLDDESVYRDIDSWVKSIYQHAQAPGLLCTLFSGRTSEGGNGCCFIKMKRAQ